MKRASGSRYRSIVDLLFFTQPINLGKRRAMYMFSPQKRKQLHKFVTSQDYFRKGIYSKRVRPNGGSSTCFKAVIKTATKSVKPFAEPSDKPFCGIFPENRQGTMEAINQQG